jgi:hypothetical protein
MITCERPLHKSVTLHDAGGVFVRHVPAHDAANLIDNKLAVPKGHRSRIYAIWLVPAKPAVSPLVDPRPRSRAAIARSLERVPNPNPLVHQREQDDNPPRVIAFEQIGRKERRIFLAPLFDCANARYRDHLQLAIA